MATGRVTKKIHVNQHLIRRNAQHNEHNPVFTVKTYKENIIAHSVFISGDSWLRYSDDPLNCGARVWIETKSPVYVTRHMCQTYQNGERVWTGRVV